MVDIKTDQPLTVCFYIQDPKRFEHVRDRLFKSLSSGDDFEGARVTAMSVHDEFQRVEMLEDKVYG